MENPATWGAAEHVIQQALDDEHRMNLASKPVIGLSLSRRITIALQEAGLLILETESAGNSQ